MADVAMFASSVALYVSTDKSVLGFVLMYYTRPNWYLFYRLALGGIRQHPHMFRM